MKIGLHIILGYWMVDAEAHKNIQVADGHRSVRRVVIAWQVNTSRMTPLMIASSDFFLVLCIFVFLFSLKKAFS